MTKPTGPRDVEGGKPAAADPVDALVLDLLEWIESGRRSHAEVLRVWRTSCPRLPVWEEANDRGFVERRRVGRTTYVDVSPRGIEHLRRHRPRRPRSTKKTHGSA